MLLRATKRLRRSNNGISPRSLGLRANTTQELVQLIQRGFPIATLVRFHEESGLSISSISEIVQIPPRTLVRRKAIGRFQPNESERLLRLAGVFDKATALFEGNTERARRWMTAPIAELDDQTPMHATRTEVGAREVEDLIGRLEYGVFA